MTVYPDTSFLVSLYVTDVHTGKASALMAKSELPLMLTPFQELELVNALYLRVFRGQILRKEAKASIALFRRDVSSGVYFQKPFSVAIFERGERLSKKRTHKTGLRMLELVHISAALECKAQALYTFDDRQRSAAKKLGLVVLPS